MKLSIVSSMISLLINAYNICANKMCIIQTGSIELAGDGKLCSKMLEIICLITHPIDNKSLKYENDKIEVKDKT